MKPALHHKIHQKTPATILDLSNMSLHDADLPEIMPLITQQQPHLSVLNLDFNAISDQGAQCLFESLLSLLNLKELSIQFNAIGRTGALALFRLKKTFPDLTILFHGNKIHDTGEMADLEAQARAE